jgi:hypothetical protein
VSVLRSGVSITRIAPTPPIKGFDRRGFVIGWIAIVAILAAGFAIMALPLNHSSSDLRFAQTTMVQPPVATGPRG